MFFRYLRALDCSVEFVFSFKGPFCHGDESLLRSIFIKSRRFARLSFNADLELQHLLCVLKRIMTAIKEQAYKVHPQLAKFHEDHNISYYFRYMFIACAYYAL